MTDEVIFVTCANENHKIIARRILFEYFDKMKLIKTIDQKGFITTTNHRVFIFTDYEIMRGRSTGYREYKMISYSYSIHYPPISDEKLIQKVTDALKELINKEKQHVDNESK